ncbi:MAG: alpha/beta hydrolase [Hylemonella sp.]|uniref:alpha/beta fold hydrolase n=1 Tax=Hylemonella sp. TaxID=2066020 RepID=UPI0022C07D12|nr:alpha/beta hydrolase [Hylemonella sp.]MCZ8253058.1 alpha/beta hydrolase [Hylemonella sp.]
MNWFQGFAARRFEVNGTSIHARVPATTRGDKPALLLVHGFPQTHVLWHRVVQQLQQNYWIVLPDLRGYGDSAQPAGLPDHSNYSKRTMAQDLVDLMDQLGCPDFFLAGHDRGGRVAARLALDHAEKVKKLCVIDIAPTLDMYAATNMDFARAYYHWFHLIQPWPLPERMIGADPQTYLHAKLGGWGSQGLSYIEPEALAEYERCFCRPEAIHGACEDYRASAGIDLEHDRASRARGDKIACDTLVLWGERGVVHRLFKPLGLWQAQCSAAVSGQLLPAGHFIPEELPAETAAALRAFFA